MRQNNRWKLLVGFSLVLCLLVCGVAHAENGEVRAYAVETANQYNLSPELVCAVISIESDWNNKCLSSANCKGLMQLSDGTGKWCAKQIGIKYDPWDYKTNIQCGCYYLNYLHEEYGKAEISEEDLVYYVLIAYNRGISGANKWIAKNGLYGNKYANKVLEEKQRREINEAQNY